MLKSRPLYAAALALAGVFALSACSSSAGGSQSNVKVLARGPDGKPTKVHVDGKDWPVCTKTNADSKNCLDATAAGLA